MLLGIGSAGGFFADLFAITGCNTLRTTALTVSHAVHFFLDLSNGFILVFNMTEENLIYYLTRIDVLREEVKYYRTLLQDHDTGHIHTTIHFLEQRIQHLEGKQQGWPFD